MSHGQKAEHGSAAPNRTGEGQLHPGAVLLRLWPAGQEKRLSSPVEHL